MTEPEWRTTTHVPAMLQSLSRRKRRSEPGGPGLDPERFRTFAVACSRRVWPLLNPALRAVVERLERPPGAVAPDLADAWDVYEAEYAALDAHVVAMVGNLFGGPVTDLRAIAELGVRQGAAAAGRLAALPPDEPLQSVSAVLGSHGPPLDERAVQADLLRCVFGNPYRPVVFDPGWRTEAVVGLARGMDEANDFAALPVLADALEDAGCADAGLLGHARGSGPHARGCHVVDHVLGKW